MHFYGHSNGPDKSKWQLLKEHLFNTASEASNKAGPSGAADFAYIAGLFHDIGKYSAAFQRRLEGSPEKVDHATAGAQEIRNLFQGTRFPALGTLLAYCIAGHHTGLPDYGSSIDIESDGTLSARLKKRLEDYSSYSTEINFSAIELPNSLSLEPIEGAKGFSVAFFTRMIFSALVDADFIDTETFMNNGRKPRGDHQDIPALNNRYNEFLKKFEQPDSEINLKRTETLQACIQKADHKPGLFSLTVPTGGGKTFASLAFALRHAVKNELRRIIYVIPYTSIIEQNAGEFKTVLGEDDVLEHHSNFDWKKEDEDVSSTLQKMKLASENWDVPITVTTNVQFFESLFASRTSSCRKLHNIANSVIIFDETQMLPLDFIKPCMYALHELIQNYGVSAVLCTATQPNVERFLPDTQIIRPIELAPNPEELYNFYKRVEVFNLGKTDDEALVQRMDQHSQALCIVNTRRHAKGLFEMLGDENAFHLSTLMCAAHRKEVIKEIRSRLKQNLPCRVISTQIMEAGIDVDFPVGYRSLSGLDSIIQAAGRVNREAEQATGKLYVFEPVSEFVKKVPLYIKQGASVANNIMRNHEDPISLQAIQNYYELLYTLQDEGDFDKKQILDCFEIPVPGDLAFNFRTAAERFRLIAEDTTPVIIPFDKTALKILEKVKFVEFPLSFSRQLQPFTVNIYKQEFDALEANGMIDVYNETYFVLADREQYNKKTGLQIPQLARGEALFFDG